MPCFVGRDERQQGFFNAPGAGQCVLMSHCNRCHSARDPTVGTASSRMMILG